MAENEKLVAALTRRLGEKEKEYVELEERYSALSDACESLEKQLDTKYKLSKIGECIAKNEHPILITGVKIGDADFCVLSQGMVYSLFYGTRKMLYFAPKAYYPADRLLESIFNECTEFSQQRFIGALDDSYLVEELERRGYTITKNK